ncbi:MAG: hypothetical protein JW818_03065 [Pirellulales bacterium]|nr:hypothetical protein [Pirellulales bacterium]
MNERPVESSAERMGRMPTEAECVEFARRIEAAARADVDALDEALDLDAVLESATGGVDGVDEYRQGFLLGAKKQHERTGGLGRMIVHSVAGGGSYRFLRVALVEGQRRVRFRLIGADASVNYHDWIVVKTPDDTIRAVDCYFFLSAELLSHTLRRGFLFVLADQDQWTPDGLAEREACFLAHADDLGAINAAFQAGRCQEVVDRFAALPELLRQEKSFLLLRLAAAARLDDPAARTKAVAEFRWWHPDDPCLAMIAVQTHVVKGEYAEALACITQTEAALGGDPYQQALRSRIHLAMGESDTARALATEALAEDPTLLLAYSTLMDLALAADDHAETRRLLDLLEAHGPSALGDLSQNPTFARFVQSPEYAAWIKRREG